MGNWRTRVDASRRASFEKARKFVRSLKLKSSQEWHEYCKSGEKPDDIPADAYRSYINKGWKSWDDFLGVKKIRKYTKDNTRPFNEAREFVCSLNLKNVDEWASYWKTHKRPNDIPSGPFQVYKKDWKGWNDFLGTGNLNAQQRLEQYYSYEDASKYVRKLGIKTSKEFYEWSVKDKPIFIPGNE